jgi:hypothetical protein
MFEVELQFVEVINNRIATFSERDPASRLSDKPLKRFAG